MAILIVLSALFSGSEAALFSLGARDRRRLRRGGVGGRIAHRLLEDSEHLLSAILFWNLLINMTYFAIASIVAGKLEADPNGGASVAAVFTVVSLLVIIFFSEMLPKSIAVLEPTRASILLAPPMGIAVRLIGPVLPVVRTSNKLAGRLLWPTFQPETDIDLADIERAVELGTDDAALLKRERVALSSMVEIADMRASELMRPRSKLKLVEPPLNRETTFEGPIPGGYVIVTDDDGDRMVGTVAVRLLRPSQLDHFEQHIEPVIYVPWSAPVARVLSLLNEQDISVAVVVDEYGDGIGALSIDRIFRRMLAPQHDQSDEAVISDAIEVCSPDRFRVSGGVSLRQFAKRLGVESPEGSVATVAGFIQRHNERLPRLGDEAILGGFRLTVIEQDDESVRIEAQRILNDESNAMEGEGI
ncbi:hemolysin activation protein [Rhodopirellula sp. MGV]|nr:hemolysin activation protein [Rhodopirellula sp. MGV]PNY33707.1 DUF21 domain-containing protein [Rhodopirellula baltica]